MDFKKLYQKHKSVIPYLFFGVCTTAVNITVYWFFARFFNIGILTATVIAFIVSVLFAYLTNRKWVFKSYANTRKEIAKEAASFFGCRIGVGMVDYIFMLVFADILALNDVFVKCAANVIVILLNYIASKLVIFKEK